MGNTDYFELNGKTQHQNLLEAAKGPLKGEYAAEMSVFKKKKDLKSVI